MKIIKKAGRNRQNKRKENKYHELVNYHHAGQSVCAWLIGGAEKALSAESDPMRLERYFSLEKMRIILAAGNAAIQIREGKTPLERYCETMSIFHWVSDGWRDVDDFNLIFDVSPFASKEAQALDFWFVFEEANLRLLENWKKVEELAKIQANGRGLADVVKAWGKPPRFDLQKFRRRIKPFQCLWEIALEEEKEWEGFEYISPWFADATFSEGADIIQESKEGDEPDWQAEKDYCNALRKAFERIHQEMI